MPDLLPLGPGPRPSHGAELLERIRRFALEGAPPVALAQADALLAATTVELDGDDIATLDVQATGLVFDESGTDVEPPTASLPGARRTPGVIRHARVHGDPVQVAGVPVTLDADASGVRFAWLETDTHAGIELIEPSDDAPITGQLSVAAPQQAVVDAARTIATRMAAEQGYDLRSLDVQFSSRGPREVALRGEAAIRKGILGASVQVAATAQIDDAMVLRFRDVSLSSGNMIVAGMLSLLRSRIEKATSEPIDLASRLPAGVRLADVRLEAGEVLALVARLH